MKTRISSQRVIGVLLAASCGFSALAHDDNPAQAPAALSPGPIPPIVLTDAPNRPGSPEFPSSDQAQKSAAAASLADKVTLSPWAGEIAKLAQAGMDESVMLTYVDSAGTFSLNSQQIIYLRNIGVPSSVMVAMMQHDAELVSGLRPPIIAVVPPPASFHFNFIPAAVVAASQAVESAKPAAAKADGTVAGPASKTQIADTEPVQFALADAVVEDAVLESAPVPSTAATSISYPVREPYPVRLSDPIAVIRAPVARPNVIVIAPLR